MRRSAKIAVGIILYALLLFVMIFPFFYMITSSFKHDADVFTQSVFYIPIPPVVNNYVRVWTEIDFLQYYLNTIKITILATAAQLFVSALAAYAFAKMQVPGKNFFLRAVYCHNDDSLDRDYDSTICGGHTNGLV